MANIETKIVAGAVGAVATFATQKLITALWKKFTGEEPPDPYDLQVSEKEALMWVAATAVGAAVSQLVVQRFVTNRYMLIGKARAAKNAKA